MFLLERQPGRIVDFVCFKDRHRGVHETFSTVGRGRNTKYNNKYKNVRLGETPPISHVLKILISNSWRLLNGTPQKNIYFGFPVEFQRALLVKFN
jgi:hypothetical protein